MVKYLRWYSHSMLTQCHPVSSVTVGAEVQLTVFQ